MDPSKIAEYEESLREVEDALVANPTNEDLRKLRDDLREILNLQVIADNPTAQVSDDDNPADSAEVVGRTCIISSSFQYALITRVINRSPDTHLPTKLGVVLFGDDEEAQVDVGEVRLLGPYDAHSLRVGSEVQALYGDGIWYNCIVKSKVKNGSVVVAYDDYDEQEEISLDRIRSRSWSPDMKKKALVSPKKEPAAKKYIMTPGGYTIPISMLVRPGDSPETREKKRKALEKLKRETKAAAIEKMYEERQSDWQNHVQKAQAKFRAQMVFTRRKH